MKVSRVLLLLLIFYINSCTGCETEESYFNSFYAQLKTFPQKVGTGLKILAKTMMFVDKFIDSTIEEDCLYSCPNRGEVLVPNPNYIMTADGCGSLGIHLQKKDLPKEVMEECCNDHDRCYGICGSDKEYCDKVFKRCVYKSCDDEQDRNPMKHKMCKAVAKLIYTTTSALGCTSFRDAQKESCLCKRNISKTQKNKNEL